MKTNLARAACLGSKDSRLPEILLAAGRRGPRLAMIVTYCAAGLSTVAAQVTGARDSAGIRIVENRTPRTTGPLFRVDPRPMMQIGSAEGAAEADFGDAISARILPNGLIAVVDLQLREIRLFDSRTGAFVRRIGRGGRGPGEFGAAPYIAASESGGIVAWDRSNRRISHFSLEGRILREKTLTGAQLKNVPNSYTMQGWEVSPSGDVLSFAPNSRIVNKLYAAEQRIAYLSTTASQPINVGPPITFRPIQEYPHMLYDPFASYRSAVMIGSRIYVSHSDLWQLDVYDTRGQLIAVFRCAVPRTQITGRLKARERVRLARIGPQFPRLFDRLKLADSTSAITLLKAGPNAQLWVGRWRARNSDDDQVFDVLNASGEWLGTVTIPAQAGDVLDVGGDRVLTVFRDGLDVPYLRLYRLRRASARSRLRFRMLIGFPIMS